MSEQIELVSSALSDVVRKGTIDVIDVQGEEQTDVFDRSPAIALGGGRGEPQLPSCLPLFSQTESG